MTRPTSSLAALRQAFLAATDATVAGPTCPSAGEIWDAAHAEVPAARAREIVHHVATCSACTADWRLAMGIADSAVGAPEPVVRRTHPAVLWVKLAGAAAVLATIGWLGLRGPGVPTPLPVFREAPDTTTIRSLVPEDQPLARAGAVLRWSPAGPGAVYTVELSADDLTPLHTEHGLTTTELPISDEVLARVGVGGKLVWSVEARLPDGSRVRSGAFVHRVE